VDLDHLWDVAQQEAARSDYSFSDTSGGLLRELITEALGGPLQSLPDDSERAREVERATRLWVYAMVLEAEKQGLEELHEQTFFGARNWLCPGFRPFC
jgi:hypothetical protein